jgi:tRNA U55 pseudouridine synthase TruB
VAIPPEYEAWNHSLHLDKEHTLTGAQLVKVLKKMIKEKKR